MDLFFFQKGFNFSQDGPGNRLVYHLQGCNLRCPWCSNPEGMALRGGKCADVDVLVDEVLRSRAMFFDGGGVTLTGGEISMQLPAVCALLEKIHAAGVHTAVETNATAPRLPELFPHLDLLIMDVKHYDASALHTVTGAVLSTVTANLRAALDAHLPVAVRIPVIGGFNAGIQHADGFADLFDSLTPHDRMTLELLPYHAYGQDKWTKLGLAYAMTDEAFVSPEVILQMENRLRQRDFHIVHT